MNPEKSDSISRPFVGSDRTNSFALCDVILLVNPGHVCTKRVFVPLIHQHKLLVNFSHHRKPNKFCPLKLAPNRDAFSGREKD